MANRPHNRRVLLLVGGWMAYQGTVSVGTLVTFNAYILMLQPPFRQLGLLMMIGQRARASAQRIFAITDTEPEISDRPGSVDLDSCRGDVEFDDVSFGYRGETKVLDGFRLAPANDLAPADEETGIGHPHLLFERTAKHPTSRERRRSVRRAGNRGPCETCPPRSPAGRPRPAR